MRSVFTAIESTQVARPLVQLAARLALLFLCASVPLAVAGDAAAVAQDVFVAAVVEQVEIAAKYSGYIDRQKGEVERAAFYENLRLPVELDYMQVSAMSIEARQRLSKFRPETLGQASRLSGITPATISLLLIHLKRGKFKGFADKPLDETDSKPDAASTPTELAQ